MYSKQDPLDVIHRLARFQLLHGVRKVFCGNLVQLVGYGFLILFNCIKSCTLQLQLHLREQEVVGGRQIWRVWGGGSMLRLVFDSETVGFLLPNALEHFRFFKSSLKICRSTVFWMLSISALNRDVTFRPSFTILSKAAMLSSVRLVVGQPLRSLSFTFSLPS